MKTRNRFFKYADTALCIALAPVYAWFSLFPKKPKFTLPIRSILVVKLCCLGDSLLSLFMLQALRKKYPQATLTVMASKRSATVFERSPAVDTVVILPVSGLGGVHEIFSLARIAGHFIVAWRVRYDILIDCDVYYRFTTLLGLVCGRQFSAGFTTKKLRASFYRFAAARPQNKPEWRCFFSLVQPLAIAEETPLPITFAITQSEIDQAKILTGPRDGQPLKVALVPGSSPNWPEKKWPLERFAELMKLWTSTGPVQFFIFGDKQEAVLVDTLRTLAPGIPLVNCAGKTTIPVLAAALKQMDLCIANDTGPMHCAALMGVPTVGIFGPTSEKKWTPPGRFSAVYANCPCRPCYYMSAMPKCGDPVCLTAIPAHIVFETATGLLGNK
ncbi:MAG: hypothetical protein A2350_16090 [Candidatus Raymondbacteria bacterium RifOxyB12_full_50_8]|uniref:Lipopolysaccharide heptosyltransferase II n=1 Tax=Candidatus Raymondbacteria bacterium RIFOXYD12_FULL_49_13 TaxID=1817890 RepID=A0A1F7FC74_UNCRA|nr:MAG: hypothetical protein A2248_03435 [Candidatus Raymondbacteria bacterium RIFOXYA2_FULL_49_16]OGJ99631.1 MAG: hypothetical protein A2350_16090 [Candidatus Raymondbacteria bacterium RifOxyB12_full_50_8]OGK04211.1 MAG: hypothetical protein A2519_17770 [Candidatus Raymondbacteria bacterium RIFOXYD12_FULL_49_13]OGP42507.1 MAG: hypothetical protein A2324_17470 [Candidatus Raymondbacteria bacterium RIFOXYB2_FULL_49_35]